MYTEVNREITKNCAIKIGRQLSLRCMYKSYRMAGNFGGKIFWRIAENMSFGKIFFTSLRHNDIHTKMANRMRWEFNRAVR